MKSPSICHCQEGGDSPSSLPFPPPLLRSLFLSLARSRTRTAHTLPATQCHYYFNASPSLTTNRHTPDINFLSIFPARWTTALAASNYTRCEITRAIPPICRPTTRACTPASHLDNLCTLLYIRVNFFFFLSGQRGTDLTECRAINVTVVITICHRFLCNGARWYLF